MDNSVFIIKTINGKRSYFVDGIEYLEDDYYELLEYSLEDDDTDDYPEGCTCQFCIRDKELEDFTDDEEDYEGLSGECVVCDTINDILDVLNNNDLDIDEKIDEIHEQLEFVVEDSYSKGYKSALAAIGGICADISEEIE